MVVVTSTVGVQITDQTYSHGCSARTPQGDDESECQASGCDSDSGLAARPTYG